MRTRMNEMKRKRKQGYLAVFPLAPTGLDGLWVTLADRKWPLRSAIFLNSRELTDLWPFQAQASKRRFPGRKQWKKEKERPKANYKREERFYDGHKSIRSFDYKEKKTFFFSFFLDASSHLYKKVCPSVCPSVRPSVRMSVRPSISI